MNNYLSTIENEFSRLRGRAVHLSPLDWHEAGKWETDGVPLHIVLGAMGDGFKKFAEKKSKGEISSIRYFIPLVNKSFAEWSELQVGKSSEVKPILRQIPFTEESNMQSSAKQFSISDWAIEILDALVDALMPDSFARLNITLPEPLASAVAKLRGEILALLDDAGQKQLSAKEIEERLTALRAEFEVSLIVSVSDDERARIVEEVKAEYGKFTLMPDVEKRTLIFKLYKKFGLPKLTLYAL